MTDTLLRALRARILDESEPLAGLLRKCLLLGAETGSDALREWARRELNGWGDQEDVPEYRKVHDAPIGYNSISGNMWAKGLTISRLQLPEKARDVVPDELEFRQPVEELEQHAGTKSLSFRTNRLAYAETMWNAELHMFQQVSNLHYAMSGSTVAGMLGQIRTKLVDFVADLTADTPLTELPGKERVDAAVHERIGDVYNTTIMKAEAALAIGSGAEAKTEGLSVDDVLRLLAEVRTSAEDVPVDDRAELDQAVDDLQATLEEDQPETGEVVRRAGKARAAAEAVAQKMGMLAITTATTTAVDAVTELAVNGAFH